MAGRLRFARPAFVAALLIVAAAVIVATMPEGLAAQTATRHPWTLPDHLRIGATDEPDNLNPMFAHTDATDQVDALIFAPLFRYDERGEFVPELATVVPTYANGGISRDSKTIVLHLRRGVTWSDGAPLTARDLRFTFRAVMNPRNRTKSLFGWQEIAALDLRGDYTAVVRLKRPYADVLGLFATGGAAYPPLPEHLLGNLADLNTAAFNAAPVSSGPFVLKAWNHGSSLEFERNPRYWRGAPKLAAISYKIVPNPETLFTQLRTHEIDLYESIPESQYAQLNLLQGTTIAKHLVANWRRLAINCRKPTLSDVRVRRAIAEAIDWDRINATVYHGYNLRAVSDIPPDSWAAPKIAPYPHDPGAARRLLEDAGWRPGPDGIRSKGGQRLALVVSATTKPGNEASEVQMQQHLRAVGIDLSIKNYPPSVLFAQNGPLYGGTYDLEWSIDTNAPDPDNQGTWSADFIPPKGANTSFLRDADITRWTGEAVRTFDRAKRKALYQKVEERVHALVPVVFFYWERSVAAYNSDFKNFRPAEYITSYWNAWEWSI